MGKATGPAYVVHFKRRREGKTDYAKRLGLIKCGLPRMVVRKTNKYVIVQFIMFERVGDKTLVGTTSKELKKYGWEKGVSTPIAYLTGLLCGLKAKEKDIKKFIPDIGLQTASKGALVFAAVKGALDAGLESNLSSELFSEERIKGVHISKRDPMVIEHFENTKRKILGGVSG